MFSDPIFLRKGEVHNRSLALSEREAILQIAQAAIEITTHAALLGYVYPKKLPDEIVHHG